MAGASLPKKFVLRPAGKKTLRYGGYKARSPGQSRKRARHWVGTNGHSSCVVPRIAFTLDFHALDKLWRISDRTLLFPREQKRIGKSASGGAEPEPPEIVDACPRDEKPSRSMRTASYAAAVRLCRLRYLGDANRRRRDFFKYNDK